jgi:hypothetical protein
VRIKAEIMDNLRALHDGAQANLDKAERGDVLRSYWSGMVDAYKRALTEVDWLPNADEVERLRAENAQLQEELEEAHQRLYDEAGGS